MPAKKKLGRGKKSEKVRPLMTLTKMVDKSSSNIFSGTSTGKS
jgi:hypothetical protein